ncbi:MAG TPA: hypothetical protein VJJ01_03025 [Nitrosopumilaceae archaeon]|nr:hypothetical protein [Nitrosopumilaceae archaeon]
MSDKKGLIEHRIEILTAVLLALIVVATAWSAYQSTLWGGIQTFLLVDSSRARMNAGALTIQQGQYSTIDVMTFMEYINALHNNDQNLTEFYFERFRPDFKPAVQAWLETNPLENPNAPPHPFVMTEYKKTFAEEAEKMNELAESKLEEANQANQNSDNYVLFTVLYASILFVGSIATRFSSGRLNLVCLVIGMAAFSVIVAAMLLLMPIATE